MRSNRGGESCFPVAELSAVRDNFSMPTRYLPSPFFVASLPIFCLLMLTPKNSVSCFVVATPGSESLVFAPQIPTSLSNIPVHIPAISSTFSHFLFPFFQFLCVLLPHHFRAFVLLILHFRVFVSRSWELSFPVFFTLQIVSNSVHPV